MKTKTAFFSYSFCAGLLLGIAPLAQADTLVTFQVDMTAQVQGATFVPATDTVYARGSFNGWPATGGLVLTNNPAAANTNLYTGTYDDTLDTNGTQLDYKFATATLGYETTANGPGDNRAAVGKPNRAEIRIARIRIERGHGGVGEMKRHDPAFLFRL